MESNPSLKSPSPSISTSTPSYPSSPDISHHASSDDHFQLSPDKDVGFNDAVNSACQVFESLYSSMQDKFCAKYIKDKVQISKGLCTAFAAFVSCLLPSNRVRFFVFVFVGGFILGSFIYVSGQNLTYAMRYEGKRLKLASADLKRKSLQGSMNLSNALPVYKKPREVERAPVNKIPHILHQSWETKSLPGMFIPWINSWDGTHPHWKHIFWTNADCEILLKKKWPKFYGHYYNNYTSPLHKYIVHRYFILYQYGGVYADLGLESLRTLDKLLQNYSCILTEQPIIHRDVLYDNKAPNYVVNSIMACKKGHPFLKFVLEMLDTYFHYDNKIEPLAERIDKAVGSLYLGDLVQLYKVAYNKTHNEFLHVLPSELLLPNYDESRRYVLVKKCLQDDLVGEQKKICNRLKETDFSNKIPDEAYIKNHWIDPFINAYDLTGASRAPVINEILANRKITTRSPSKLQNV